MEVHEKRKLLGAIEILVKRPAQADETTLGIEAQEQSHEH